MKKTEKTPLLRDYYSAEEPLFFHQFEVGYHAHFSALYHQIGIPRGAFGGNAQGALYVYPKRLSHGMIVVSISGRGVFADNTDVQVIPLESVRFISRDGHAEDPGQELQRIKEEENSPHAEQENRRFQKEVARREKKPRPRRLGRKRDGILVK